MHGRGKIVEISATSSTPAASGGLSSSTEATLTTLLLNLQSMMTDRLAGLEQQLVRQQETIDSLSKQVHDLRAAPSAKSSATDQEKK